MIDKFIINLIKISFLGKICLIFDITIVLKKTPSAHKHK
jgi:hypothetical protein